MAMSRLTVKAEKRAQHLAGNRPLTLSARIFRYPVLLFDVELI